MPSVPPALRPLPLLRGAPALPIDAVSPDVLAALDGAGTAVVVAPPGAGKTTRLPLALLDAAWRGDGRVLVLEPRRIAARAAATQMARLLGEEVGETVGYRVRLESRVGPRTRVEVVTEGILTRMVQDDPTLEGVAAVLFDEFHERHLTADLGLALCLETRQVLRPDLRLLVMSATLEAAPVARLLGDAPVIVSEGRSFPVATSWRPPRSDLPIALATAQAVRAQWDRTDGDLLVFLPGIAELDRTRRALEDPPLGDAEVLLLHGGLTLAEQDHVLRRSGTRRRVVLSTAIAESSVTLPDVRVVIDAGLARVPRFDPRSGMTRLETTRVSQAAADQRRGRAGRVAEGTCVRLWSESEHAAMPARTAPEILEADLAPLALELACAGIVDASQLRWLDAPPAGALAQGRALLTDLGALDATGRVTAHGRRMAALGVVPRLAHLVLVAAERGLARLGCELAALLGERDVLRRDAAANDADLRTRVELLRGAGRMADADRGRLDRVRQEARALQRAVRGSSDGVHDDLAHTGALLALAYPDRVAMRRTGDAARYLLRNGRGARLDVPGAMARETFLAIADLDGDPTESRIWLAAPLDESDLRAAVGAGLTTEREVTWDERSESVRATERERIGALVLKERPIRDVSPEVITEALLGALRARGIASLPWTTASTALRARIAFAHAMAAETFPDVSDDALLARLDAWLAPSLREARRLSDVARVDLGEALLAGLPWAERARLDRIAPTHIEVPSGSRLPIDYTEVTAPTLAVRLQAVFGWTETPRVGEGRVPLTLHLLSPAHRPVQVTRDLANFWRTTYFEVRRDLKGRYPRHPWPDDPLSAPATRRAKPRGT
ncbi:MAG: ATP-dependent helicase HrpB [Gemmatimonadaceae bacterium]|nr:ATP-dependent helicase HrpB [Gemmatimonadaceae bacterium]